MKPATLSTAARFASALFTLGATTHAQVPGTTHAATATTTTTTTVPIAYAEQQVTFQAGTRTIYGTLAVPSAPGRHAAVMLIAGSGPTDRDWNSPGMPGTNGSARLLARALASRGYVVLRYDKLGTGQTPAPAVDSWAEYTAEQTAALAFLRTNPAVDPARIVVAGHSEGGEHAIRLVGHLPAGEHVAGLILLSSAGRSIRDTLVTQLTAQFTAGGVTGPALAGYMNPISAALDAIIAGRPPDFAAINPVPVRQLVAGFLATPTNTFRHELLGYDPATGLRDVHVPVLVVNGGRDVQISPALDGRPLEQAARAAGNRDVTAHLVEHADHVFKHEERAFDALSIATSVARYNAPDRTLDPDLVETLVAWLARHTR